MKNRFATLVVSMALALITFTASAQFNLLSEPHYNIAAPCIVLTQSGATDLSTTNRPIDMHGYGGVGSLVFFTTNTAGTSPKIYAFLEGSSDLSTWTSMTNVSVAFSNSIIYTNIGSSVLYATNVLMIPGTLTTATTASAGFAGTYLTPEPFTNRATICTNTTGGTFTIGLVVPDQPRYWRLVTTVTGSNSVFTIGGMVIARKQNRTF